MTAPVRNVRTDLGPIAKSLYSRLVASSIREIQARYGLSDVELARIADCSTPTICNARNEIGQLSGRIAFNLILASPTAIDRLLHYFDRRSVPLGARCDTDALEAVTSLTNKLVTKQQDPRDIDSAIATAIEALVSLQNERAAA